MAGLRQGNNDVTADDDMAFFRTCMKYTKKMFKYHNFEFRQDAMALVKEYVFKRKQRSKANEKINSRHQLKRKMPDDSCAAPSKKKVLNVFAKPKIKSAVEVNFATSADVPIQESNKSTDSGPSMSTAGKSKQPKEKHPVFMRNSAACEIMAGSGMSQEEVNEVLAMALAKVKKEELENQDDNPIATAFARGFCGGEPEDVVQIDILGSDDE